MYNVLITIDIKYDDIDENLWKSGMAMNHGEDREGNPVGRFSLMEREREGMEFDRNWKKGEWL